MGCLIDADCGECYEELLCEIVKSRKQWNCCECRTVIPKGEKYEVFVGEINGDIHTHRTCLTCLSIRKKFCCNWTYEGLYEDIYNAIDADPKLEDCILMQCSKEQYDKMVQYISFLDQDLYGEDEEDD